MNDLEAVLETYSFEELIELNDLTEEEVLRYLVEHKVLKLPEYTPCL